MAFVASVSHERLIRELNHKEGAHRSLGIKQREKERQSREARLDDIGAEIPSMYFLKISPKAWSAGFRESAFSAI